MSKIREDWRLPTIVELSTLINYDNKDKACDLEDTRLEFYWSSTTYAVNTNGAWGIDFSYGDSSYYKKSGNYYYVRCVRGSKEDGLQWSKTSENTMTWYEAIEYAKNLKAKTYYKAKK